MLMHRLMHAAVEGFACRSCKQSCAASLATEAPFVMQDDVYISVLMFVGFSRSWAV